MRITKLIAVLFLFITVGIQSGCTPQNELGNLSVVTGFFLDTSSHEYILLADCRDFSKQTQSGNLQTKKICVTGKTLQELFQNLEAQSQAPLCIARAKVLLMKNPKNTLLQELFDLKILPSDISILQTDLSVDLLKKEENSFAPDIDTQLKKTKNFSSCKLYQLIKNPQNIARIPSVLLSENGFYLCNPEINNLKEGGL